MHQAKIAFALELEPGPLFALSAILKHFAVFLRKSREHPGFPILPGLTWMWLYSCLAKILLESVRRPTHFESNCDARHISGHHACRTSAIFRSMNSGRMRHLPRGWISCVRRRCRFAPHGGGDLGMRLDFTNWKRHARRKTFVTRSTNFKSVLR